MTDIRDRRGGGILPPSYRDRRRGGILPPSNREQDAPSPIYIMERVGPKYGHGNGYVTGPGQYFDSNKYTHIRYGGNLPHWQQEGVMQFVTFRLGNSLPQIKLEEFKIEKEKWMEEHPKPWTENEFIEYDDLLSTKEYWLDQGYGECILSIKIIRDFMESVLKFNDGKLYDLYDYVIMPNHIHLLMVPAYGIDMKQIMHSIKSYSAKIINKRLNRKGKVWQEESWDRMIRSKEDHQAKAEYIKHNFDGNW